MELCLYEPELGYYSRAREQFGKAGDFYTSSDVHAVFGRLLARQFEEMWRALDSPERVDLVRTRSGTRIVCPRRAGLVGEAVSRVCAGATLYAGGAVSSTLRAKLRRAASRAHIGAEGAASLALVRMRRVAAVSEHLIRIRQRVLRRLAGRCHRPSRRVARRFRAGAVRGELCPAVRGGELSSWIATACIRKKASG